MIWLFAVLVLGVSHCNVSPSYRVIHEVGCEDDLIKFQARAETFILPACLHSKEHWISHIRAQNPAAQIFVEAIMESIDQIIELGRIEGVLVKKPLLSEVGVIRAAMPESLRLIVELDLIFPFQEIPEGTLKAHDAIIFRDFKLLTNDAFMKQISTLFMRTGVLWAFLNSEIPQRELNTANSAFWRWAQYGGLGIDSRWLNWGAISGIDIKRTSSIPPILKDLIGWQPKEIMVFDTYPFRTVNEFGLPECIPGKVFDYYQSPMLIEINPRPEWPHRIAYHGFSKEETLSAIRASGWKLKPCVERCWHGKGVYSSPSFAIATRHYGCGLQKHGKFYRMSLQVAIRRETAHYNTIGDRFDDPQWQEYNFPEQPPGVAPEFLVENPEDVVVTGLIVTEIFFSFFRPNTLNFQL